MELEASEHAAGEGDRAARLAALQVSVGRAQADVMAQKVKVPASALLCEMPVYLSI